MRLPRRCMPTNRRLSARGRAPVALAALACAMLFAACAAHAQERRPKGGDAKVDLQILVIRATKDHDKIPDELRGMADKLKEHGFTGFTIEKRLASSTSLGDNWSTALVGPYSAQLTPLSRDDDKKKIEYRVKLTKKSDDRGSDRDDDKVRNRSKVRTPRRGEDDTLANTTLRSSPGAVTLFKLAYPDASKDGLLIAVSAR